VKTFLILLLLSLVNLSAVDFTKDIKPIFDARCAKCHGEKTQKSDFRLDHRDSILKGGDLGKPGAIPGQPDQSTIIKLISLDEDHDDIMPPKGDPLSKKDIELISTWILEGVKMPEKEIKEVSLWSLDPVKKPQVPQLSKNAIDAFLLEKLSEKKLNFSQTADPVTLLRRLQVILTGMLPSAEESQTFVQQWQTNSTLAYEAKVDELLASAQFGERWAQHWLDSVRWSETNGSESNEYRKYSWQYRDYVIRAFNTDKPYTDFIVDQLAGDQTGEPRATGFLVAGPHVPAGTVGREPSAVRQAKYDRLDQIMQSLGSSMVGMTLGCARCHSHKFDPIKINDYYSILANFQGVEYGVRKPEFSENLPEVKNDQKLRAELKKQRDTQTNKLWREDWQGHNEIHSKEPMKTSAVRFSFTGKVFLDEIEIFSTSGANIAAKAEVTTTCTGDYIETTRFTDGIYGYFDQFRGLNKDDSSVVFQFTEPVNITHLTISADRESGKLTDYLTKKVTYSGPLNFKIEIKNDQGQWTSLATKAQSIPQPANVQKAVESLIENGIQHEFLGRFVKPDAAHILMRGSPESLGDEVPPAAIATVTSTLGIDSKTPESKRRLTFAKWLANEQNPLTARVMVNRLWHHTFGTGIVSTLSDFGNAGAPPSHPELIDYLAAEFMGNNWSVKKMLKSLVMTQAFMQDSKPLEQGLALDSDARLLWRYPPQRVEAEVIRDSILKLSASLNNEVGGISYRIHNVKEKYDIWEVVDNHSESTWRRMIYQERMRGIDDRMFMAFDFPDCGQVMSQRPKSTTPLQALNLMNSKFIEEQAEILASHLKSGTNEESINRLFMTVFNRKPDQQEMNNCLEIVKQTSLTVLCRALMNTNEFTFIQ
jgi:hypothetical protein